MASVSSLLLSYCQSPVTRHHPSSMMLGSKSSISSAGAGRFISVGKPNKVVVVERLNNRVNNNVVTMCAPLMTYSGLDDLKRSDKIRIFSGTANRFLSREVASLLDLDLAKICIKSLANQETYVRLMEESVCGCDVYIIQPTCAPVNDNLMELTMMIDACRHAFAKTITVIIPYFGYARVVDHPNHDKESHTTRLVAQQIEKAGADRIVVMDIHNIHSLDHLNIPVVHLHAQSIMLDYITSKAFCWKDVVVVSPDIEGIDRALAFAKELCGTPLRFAVIDENRFADTEDRYDHNATKAVQLTGDVQGKVAILYDDMIDTAGTVMEGALLLRREGAIKVYVCAIHAVFSPPAIRRLSNGLSNGLIDEVIVTNTIPVSMENYQPKLTVLSVARLLQQNIWNLHKSDS